MAKFIPFLLVTYTTLPLPASTFSIPPLSHLPAFLRTGAAQTPQVPLQDDLESWISWEESVAMRNLLANIAPKGQDLEGAVKGSVLASPSREHPNYFYQCRHLVVSRCLNTANIHIRGPRCRDYYVYPRRCLRRRSCLQTFCPTLYCDRRLCSSSVETPTYLESIWYI